MRTKTLPWLSLLLLLDKLFREPKMHPMQAYLQKRGQWLHLNTLTSQRQFTASINPDDGVAKLVIRDKPQAWMHPEL